MFVLSFGLPVKQNFGHFVYTSTHGGHTMLMGGNKYATGAHNARSFEAGARGFIENAEKMTFSEKGAYWQSQAIDWITSNPLQWLSLMPKKLFYTFIWDDWSLPGLVNTSEWNLFMVLKMVLKEREFNQVFNGESLVFKVAFVALHLSHHACYFILLALMLFQFRAYKRTSWPTRFRIFTSSLVFLYALQCLVLGAPATSIRTF